MTRPSSRTARERLSLWAVLARRTRAARGDERGDVPGWVLVTLMTAGLVTALWILAGDTLSDVFSEAIKNVTP